VGGIKGIDVHPEESRVTLRRTVADGVEVYEAPLPAAAAVKEGLNLPRYPSITGRIKAKKAQIRIVRPEVTAGGLRKLPLPQPREDPPDTEVLGRGPEAAGAVVDLFEEIGVV
jgi:electron transfer flavoprotein beta subunit